MAFTASVNVVTTRPAETNSRPRTQPPSARSRLCVTRVACAVMGVDRFLQVPGAAVVHQEDALPDTPQRSGAELVRPGPSEDELVGERGPHVMHEHVGVQVRMATELWNETRSESQKAAKLEIITTYEPLAKFSKELLAVINRAVPEATLEGELLR